MSFDVDAMAGARVGNRHAWLILCFNVGEA